MTIERIHRGIWRTFGAMLILVGIVIGIAFLASLGPSEAERTERAMQYREAIREAAVKGGKRCDLLLKYELGVLIRDVRTIYATCLQGKRTAKVELAEDHRAPLTDREKQELRHVLGDR